MGEPAAPRQRLTAATLALGVDVLCDSDPDMAAVVGRFGPPPLWLRRPGFACLTRIILEQQVSLVSARAAYGRLRRAVGRVTPRNVLGVRPEQLYRAGITRQKTRYCRELARQVEGGELELRPLAELDDAEVCRRLQQVTGIGRWTAEVYLLMALGRPDIWPWGDVALATAVWRLKCLDQRPDYDSLTELARAWRPWRAVAARILWHYYLCARRRGQWHTDPPNRQEPDR